MSYDGRQMCHCKLKISGCNLITKCVMSTNYLDKNNVIVTVSFLTNAFRLIGFKTNYIQTRPKRTRL